MIGEGVGIAVIGSTLVDKINEISVYPKCGELTEIKSVSYSVGGCVPNVSIDLKRIDPKLSVLAVGKVGDDEEGRYLIKELRSQGVDTSNIGLTDKKTSFTEVMSITRGQRTFFTYNGASSDFGYRDVDLDNLGVKMLHLGYFLLLDKIDNGDGVLLLKKARSLGIQTSIDLVSRSDGDYSSVISSLPYVDNLIINETEASGLLGVPYSDDKIGDIAEGLKALGVCDRVIIHTPSLSICVRNSGRTLLPSYDLPKEYVKGTTGAGDAFTAGALIGIYKNKTDEEILELATISAAASLSSADATSGVRNEEELTALTSRMKRRKLCL